MLTRALLTHALHDNYKRTPTQISCDKIRKNDDKSVAVTLLILIVRIVRH